MNTGSVPRTGQPTPSVTCRVCGTVVPLGAFCGSCGAHLSPQRGNGPDWLRIRAYGAAPGEHLLRVSVVSSLFPHLPHRSRTAFRLGLAALVVVLVLVALLHWQAALIRSARWDFPCYSRSTCRKATSTTICRPRAAGRGGDRGCVRSRMGGADRPAFCPLRHRCVGVSGQVVLRDGLAIPLGGAAHAGPGGAGAAAAPTDARVVGRVCDRIAGLSHTPRRRY